MNNAGLSRGLDKLYMGRIEDWEEMIDTNVKGLLYLSRAVVPGMVTRGRGHVVNLGSTAGELTYPNGAVYCATKAAERAINDGLRQDLLGTPVRVTSVDPGMVETDFSLVRFHGDAERAAKVYKGITPLTPEDVAEFQKVIGGFVESVVTRYYDYMPKISTITGDMTPARDSILPSSLPALMKTMVPGSMPSCETR